MQVNALKKEKKQLVESLILLAFLLVITGTYAWTQFNNIGFNPIWTERENHGARLHVHYHNPNLGQGAGEHNKDVFVENFNDPDTSTRSFMIRVQIREFMRIDDVEIGGGGIDINNPSTWPIYEADGNNVHQRRAGSPAAEIGDTGVTLQLGHGNESKIFMPTFNRADRYARSVMSTVPSLFNRLDAYIMSDTSGQAVEFFAGDFNNDLVNSNIVNHAGHFLLYGTQTGAGVTDIDIPVSVHTGEHNYWYSGERFESRRIEIDDEGQIIVTAPVFHYAQETLLPMSESELDTASNTGVTWADLSEPFNGGEFRGVMTVNQWDALGRPDGNFWIMDTEYKEGWFWWNGFLGAGEATSLLIDDLYLPTMFSSDWEYLTDVFAEFFIPLTQEGLQGSGNNIPPWDRPLPESENGDETVYHTIAPQIPLQKKEFKNI